MRKLICKEDTKTKKLIGKSAWAHKRRFSDIKADGNNQTQQESG